MRRSVSIIIPVKEINDYIRESIPYILAMDYENYEIIIFPDNASKESFARTTVIPTGDMGPAEKRDLALKYAKGEILAFLDDDAYPERDWLSKAVRHFDDEKVAAVGGPAVTPKSDSILQRASGAVFSTWLASGGNEYRYVPGAPREVDDYPTVNLLVRKDIFREAGGFDSDYWPGEDTKLCLDITKKLGKKIIYDPEAVVYHHRRPLFVPHLRQISRYAFHRGYFAKVLPETSLRLSYFVPSLFLIGIVAGVVLSAFYGPAAKVYVSTISIYFFMLLATAFSTTIRERKILVGVLTIPGIFLTHILYGFNFLRGLSTTRYRR
ncbi:MAG: glycosyltransferase [Thermodesulfobacteriota bacterium]|nr:MAG: glycosyltransferase [Thermodesulfobacteriota bacterium]